MRHFAIPEDEFSATEAELAVAFDRLQPGTRCTDDVLPVAVLPVAIIALDRDGTVFVIPVPDVMPYGTRP